MIKTTGWQAADVFGVRITPGQHGKRYDDGELLTLITLAKKITQASFIRNLPQDKERRGQVAKGYTVRS